MVRWYKNCETQPQQVVAQNLRFIPWHFMKYSELQHSNKKFETFETFHTTSESVSKWNSSYWWDVVNEHIVKWKHYNSIIHHSAASSLILFFWDEQTLTLHWRHANGSSAIHKVWVQQQMGWSSLKLQCHYCSQHYIQYLLQCKY
jgi:hypothetical protein